MMGRVDLLAILGNEGDVAVRRFLPGLEQAQRNFTGCLTKFNSTRQCTLRNNSYAERL